LQWSGRHLTNWIWTLGQRVADHTGQQAGSGCTTLVAQGVSLHEGSRDGGVGPRAHSPRNHGVHGASPLILDLVQVAVANARVCNLNAHVLRSHGTAVEGERGEHARFVAGGVADAVGGRVDLLGRRLAEQRGEGGEGDLFDGEER
jgi:hypothetical protein